MKGRMISLFAFMFILTTSLAVAADAGAKKGGNNTGTATDKGSDSTGGAASKQGGNGSTDPATPAAAGTMDALPGITYDLNSLVAPPNDFFHNPDKWVLVCYKLKAAQNTTIPFFLQPVYQVPIGTANDGTHHYRACTPLGEDHPLVRGQRLLIAIDASELDSNRLAQLQTLNMNLTFKQGTPLNAAPLAPSVTQSTVSGAGAVQSLLKQLYSLKISEENIEKRVYYLAWPDALPGDAKVNFSFISILAPPDPGKPRQSNTIYPQGSVVKEGASYYTAQTGGISANVPFPAPESGIVVDGAVVWSDHGTLPPPEGEITGRKAAGNNIGDVYYDKNKHFYVALTKGKPAGKEPKFEIANKVVFDGSVVWSYAGDTPPDTIANLSAQKITLLPQSQDSQPQLPQVHDPYYFFLTAGMAASTVKERTHTFSSSGIPQQTSSNPLVDPVLFLSYFPVPVDNERLWKPANMFTTCPGISAGFSLTSPDSRFYLGATFVPAPNVLLITGVNFAKTSDLSPAVTTGTAGTTPATVNRFHTGAFVALSFNFTGFAKALFMK